LDRVTADKLAAIAGVDIDELAQAMFEAGEALDGKTPEEVFHQDYKTFVHGDLQLGVGQGSFISRGNYEKAEAMISEFLPQAQPQLGVDMAFYLLTSLQDQSSLVLSAGAGAQALLCRAFRAEAGANGVLLPGVVSRKKQFIPQLLRALQDEL
jgi:manganese-dependent inorganic pyrophosphatase